MGVAADAHLIKLAPHNPQSPVNTMASLHLDFALHNAAIQEVAWPFAPEVEALFDGDLTIEHGHALPPTAPGLGMVLDEAAARALEAAGPAAPPALLRYTDGAPAEL